MAPLLLLKREKDNALAYFTMVSHQYAILLDQLPESLAADLSFTHPVSWMHCLMDCPVPNAANHPTWIWDTNLLEKQWPLQQVFKDSKDHNGKGVKVCWPGLCLDIPIVPSDFPKHQERMQHCTSYILAPTVLLSTFSCQLWNRILLATEGRRWINCTAP